MDDPAADDLGARVLVLAPTARDASASVRILQEAGVAALALRGVGELCEEAARGAGAAILTEEAVLSDADGCLARLVGDQPRWSDLPLIVLASAGPESPRAVAALLAVGNVRLLKRPVQVSTLVSAATSALRDRRRQYQLRDHLVEEGRQASALRATKDSLAFALEAGRLGSWELDLVTGRVDCSALCKANFGLAADAGLTHESLLERIHPDDRGRVAGAIGRSIAGRAPYEVEYRNTWPDGSTHWVLVRGRVAPGAGGEPARMAGVSLDITERKRADEVLRESLGRFRFLDALGEATRAIDDPVAIMATTARMLGRHLGATRCAYADVEPDGDRFVILDDWTDGAPSTAGRYSLDLFGPRAAAEMRAGRTLVVRDVDGELRPGEGAEMFNAIGIKAIVCCPLVKRGRLSAMMAVHHATPRPWSPAEVALVEAVVERSWAHVERARSESARREAAGRRTDQLRRVAEVAARLNAAHDVESVARLLTEEARGLIGSGRAVTRLAARPDRPPEEFVSRPGGPAEAGGPDAPAGRISAPLVGRDGADIGAVRLSGRREGGFTEDDRALLAQLAQMASVAIENARLYEELRGNDRRKDEFLAMLAHELRNPMAAVRGAVGVLGMSGSEDDVRFAKDVIDRQVRQLVRLIDDLLDVSRINSGKIRLKAELVDAGPILRQALESVRPLVDERKHRVVAEFDEGALPLRADPTRVEQIVVNLLANAAKYTEAGGLIRLGAAREGGHVVITVRDNGIGIPPEKLPEMFELFAQGERSIARSEGGLGIGLTIVRKLAELHGGSVSAASDGPGRGSEFTVRLPAAEASARARPARAPAAAGAGRGSRILVVDDNVDTARGMARLLKLVGNVVAVAHDGPSAIEAARGLGPEVVLLDIGLPGMDGYQVASRLREDESARGAVIIAVSGYGQEEDRRRSRAAGFDHHLVKPVDFDALVDLIGGAR